ncbi:hypothetical protein AB0D57_47900, partial [Streptomyces sp. NPDC048275]
MAGVITVSEPSWTGPFIGLSPRCFTQLVSALGPVRRIKSEGSSGALSAQVSGVWCVELQGGG